MGRFFTMNKKGMTILEVVIAFMILAIGIGFLLMSNKAYFSFRQDRQERQQMLYYAAGQLEAAVEGQTVSYNEPPFNQYSVDIVVVDDAVNPYLQKVQLTLYKTTSPNDPEPVHLYTYRVKVDE